MAVVTLHVAKNTNRMNHLEGYLRSIRTIRASGSATAETSLYPPLAELLNALGAELRPKVACVLTLANRGAGLPDGGLFTADQLGDDPQSGFGAGLPARGVIEIKGVEADVAQIAQSAQVQRYLGLYGQVLVTNYRDFLLLGRDAAGRPLPQERYTLAPNATAFWAQLSNAEFAAQHAEPFTDYLRRVMLANAPLTNPADVAWFLASYARTARARTEQANLADLRQLREALEQALGLSFTADQGDHFFRSTFVQTLFYGMFAGWMIWHNTNPPENERYDWRLSAHHLHVPIIRALFEMVTQVGRLRRLNLIEVLDWACAALNRVDRPQFFSRFDEGQAVQYFYEPFLAAFDPDLRRELGVWYTPPEVVEYMVERVHQVLQTELGIADGLADEQVVVLDPCTGTGAFLVGVLKRIAQTLGERGEDALLAAELQRAALTRVFGFELLSAPYVIAHLQIELLLQQFGAPLNSEQRAGIFLTNALTGWEPPGAGQRAVQLRLAMFEELGQERDAAEQIKQQRKVLVVIGNPPYNGYAGAAIAEERGLVDAYRRTQHAPAPQGQGLNDLYVRFFRIAERQIAERSGYGVVCYISNYSWLDGLSFTGMRERYLQAFDQIWIDSLNGDKYRTGKVTPSGDPDPSIFSTEFNREGIQVGTAIATLVRNPEHRNLPCAVQFRQFWGRDKRDQLEQITRHNAHQPYQTMTPEVALGYPFAPTEVRADYLTWPLLPELFPVSFPGVKTSRDAALVEIDREVLETRMRQYFDPSISHAEMRQIAPVLMEKTSSFSAESVRDSFLQQPTNIEKGRIIRFCYRPFDLRWLYWNDESQLLDRSRPEYIPHIFSGNSWMVSQQKPRREWSLPQVIRNIGCLDLMDRGASCIPLLLAPNTRQTSLFDAEQHEPQPNLSDQAKAYLNRLGAEASDLFYHSIAVLHTPAYRRDNAGGLRQDWPRIPLPDDLEVLQASAQRGRILASLLDPEQPVAGVTSGTIRPELRSIGSISKQGGGQIAPDGTDLHITARWGIAGRGGITMPSRGKTVERAYSDAEQQQMGAAAPLLGPDTRDIYLNELVYWRNVPTRVWEYTLGGYQVIKKWLSYREASLLGRGLRLDEVREVSTIARRIAAILLLEAELEAGWAAIVGLSGSRKPPNCSRAAGGSPPRMCGRVWRSRRESPTVLAYRLPCATPVTPYGKDLHESSAIGSGAFG